jgi:hypothetical protein
MQMKNKFIFNPFVQIAGLKSLCIGLSVLFVTSYISYKTGTHFYGLVNIDFAKDSDFWIYLVEISSHWIILSILFYLAGSILSKSKLRAIDIFGTTLFARIPLVIAPLIRIIPVFRSFAFQSASMYLIIAIYMVSLIWTVVLLFNAFKISCNLKNEILIVSFIVSIILSEVLTKLLLFIFI